MHARGATRPCIRAFVFTYIRTRSVIHPCVRVCLHLQVNTHLDVLGEAELLPDPARGEGRGGVLVPGVLLHHGDARALLCAGVWVVG